MLGEEGTRVGQPIIGGAIVAGDKEKDADALADRIFELHRSRDTFREQTPRD